MKGEAGIGKTSLIYKFKKQFLSRGYNFFAGRAYFDNAEPYLPFKEAFRTYREPGDSSINFPIYEIEDRGMEKGERESIFYRTKETIKHIASKNPLVIFLDDLQWADRTSLQMLYYLIDKTRDSPIFFLCPFRPEDVEEDHPLKELMQRLSRSHRYAEIHLEALDWQDTKDIVQNLIGRKEVPDGFVKLIYSITNGNPLFIKECTEQMLDEGTIDPKNHIYPTSREDIEIPRIINDIIEKRIKRLGKETKKVLKIGSVMGEKITFDLLSNVSKKDEFELLNHLDILVGADLLDDEASEERFYFSHGLIQLSVYEKIPETIRKRYHLKIARSIEDLYEDTLSEHFTELGFHYERGEEYEDSVDYYIKAGKKAEDVYAYENAVEMYKRSLHIMDRISESKFDDIQLYERLGDAYRIMGKYKKCRNYFKKAIENSDDTNTRATLYWKIGGSYLDQGNYDSALDSLEEGLSNIDEDGPIKCRILDRKGWGLMRKGKFQRVKEIFEEEKEVAEKIDDQKEIAQAVHNKGALCLKRGEYEDVEECFHQAIELREKIEDERGLSSSYNNLGIVYSNQGDLDSSLKYLNESLKIVEKIGDIRSASLSLLNIGEEYYNKGELDKAQNKYEESLAAKKKIDDREGKAFCYNYIGEVFREKDMISEAKENHEKGLNIAEDIKNQKMVITSLLSLAQDHLKSSEISKGKSLAQEALEKAGGSSLKNLLYRAKRIVGKAYRLNEDYEKAEEHLKKAKEQMEKGGDKKEYGKVLYELGLLYLDKEEEGEKYLTEALDTFEDIGMELWMEKANEALDPLS